MKLLIVYLCYIKLLVVYLCYIKLLVVYLCYIKLLVVYLYTMKLFIDCLTSLGMVTALDAAIGRVLTALQEANMFDDTLFFFTPDVSTTDAFITHAMLILFSLLLPIQYCSVIYNTCNAYFVFPFVTNTILFCDKDHSVSRTDHYYEHSVLTPANY